MENNKVEKKQLKQKEIILEKLKKTPIVQVVCKQAGIARATFYRWKKNDSEFAQKAEEAIISGSLLINDMAESQLVSAIRDRNLTAIIFWLKNHHSLYKPKLEIDANIKQSKEKLTPEQEETVKKALELAGLSYFDINDPEDKNNEERTNK